MSEGSIQWHKYSMNEKLLLPQALHDYHLVHDYVLMISCSHKIELSSMDQTYTKICITKNNANIKNIGNKTINDKINLELPQTSYIDWPYQKAHGRTISITTPKLATSLSNYILNNRNTNIPKHHFFFDSEIYTTQSHMYEHFVYKN